LFIFLYSQTVITFWTTLVACGRNTADRVAAHVADKTSCTLVSVVLLLRLSGLDYKKKTRFSNQPYHGMMRVFGVDPAENMAARVSSLP
jgi:hypothetical protein